MRRVAVPQIMEADSRQVGGLDQAHPFVGKAAWLNRAAVIGGDDKGLNILPQAELQHFLGLPCAPFFKLFDRDRGEVNIAAGTGFGLLIAYAGFGLLGRLHDRKALLLPLHMVPTECTYFTASKATKNAE